MPRRLASSAVASRVTVVARQVSGGVVAERPLPGAVPELRPGPGVTTVPGLEAVPLPVPPGAEPPTPLDDVDCWLP